MIPKAAVLGNMKIERGPDLLNRVRVGAGVNPDTGEGGVARAMHGLGKSFARAGDAGLQEGLRWQEEVNKNNTIRAYGEYSASSREFLDELLSLRGDDAGSVVEDFGAFHKQRVEELGKGQTAEMRRRFGRITQRDLDTRLNMLMRFAEGQHILDNNLEQRNLVDTAIANGLQGLDLDGLGQGTSDTADPGVLQDAIESVTEAVEGMEDLSELGRELELARQLSKLHSGVVDRFIAAERLEDASYYLERYKGVIEPEREVSLRQEIDRRVMVADEADFVDDLMGQNVPKWVAMDKVRDEFSGAARRRVLEETKSRFTEEADPTDERLQEWVDRAIESGMTEPEARIAARKEFSGSREKNVIQMVDARYREKADAGVARVQELNSNVALLLKDTPPSERGGILEKFEAAMPEGDRALWRLSGSGADWEKNLRQDPEAAKRTNRVNILLVQFNDKDLFKSVDFRNEIMDLYKVGFLAEKDFTKFMGDWDLANTIDSDVQKQSNTEARMFIMEEGGQFDQFLGNVTPNRPYGDLTAVQAAKLKDAIYQYTEFYTGNTPNVDIEKWFSVMTQKTEFDVSDGTGRFFGGPKTRKAYMFEIIQEGDFQAAAQAYAASHNQENDFDYDAEAVLHVLEMLIDLFEDRGLDPRSVDEDLWDALFLGLAKESRPDLFEEIVNPPPSTPGGLGQQSQKVREGINPSKDATRYPRQLPPGRYSEPQSFGDAPALQRPPYVSISQRLWLKEQESLNNLFSEPQLFGDAPALQRPPYVSISRRLWLKEQEALNNLYSDEDAPALQRPPEGANSIAEHGKPDMRPLRAFLSRILNYPRVMHLGFDKDDVSSQRLWLKEQKEK